MKSFHSICSILLCLIIYSCTTNQSNNKDKISFKQTIKLTAADSIDLEKAYGILNPTYITSSNDSIWIVVGDEASELVYLLDNSWKCKAKGIRLGKGPSEVLEISSIHHIDGRTVVYDGRKGELSEVLRADSNLFLAPIVSRLNMQDDAFMLPNGYVLAMPVTGGYSYALLDKSKKIIDTLAYYPPKPKGVTDQTHHLACTGTAALIPKHAHLARTLAYEGAIDFFSLDQSQLRHISRQEEFGMDYAVINVGQPVPTLSETTRTGYWSLAASNDTFYALFSDELAKESSGNYREIHAFSSEGAPLCKYLPDHELSSLAVKPDNSKLYGIGTTVKGSVTLYVYDISQ